MKVIAKIAVPLICGECYGYSCKPCTHSHDTVHQLNDDFLWFAHGYINYDLCSDDGFFRIAILFLNCSKFIPWMKSGYIFY